jgi:hypothetical protein
MGLIFIIASTRVIIKCFIPSFCTYSTQMSTGLSSEWVGDAEGSTKIQVHRSQSQGQSLHMRGLPAPEGFPFVPPSMFPVSFQHCWF